MEEKEVIVLENVPIEFTTKVIPNTFIVGDREYRCRSVSEIFYLEIQEDPEKNK